MVAKKTCGVVLAGVQGVKLDAFCIRILPAQSDSGVNHPASRTWISFQSGKVGLLGKAGGGVSKQLCSTGGQGAGAWVNRGSVPNSAPCIVCHQNSQTVMPESTIGALDRSVRLLSISALWRHCPRKRRFAFMFQVHFSVIDSSGQVC